MVVNGWMRIIFIVCYRVIPSLVLFRLEKMIKVIKLTGCNLQTADVQTINF